MVTPAKTTTAGKYTVNYDSGGNVLSKTLNTTPAAPKTSSVTKAPATSMPVSQESAARGVSASGPAGQRNISYATTLSNTNKIDQVPKDITALQSLSQKGQVSDGETIYNADGSQVRQNNLNAMSGTNAQISALDEEEKKQLDVINKLYEGALSNLDANTASLVANAQRQAEQLRKDTNEVSRVQSKSLNNALLMGGATGQGSSARYAPVASEGILAAQEGYRVKQIMAIDQKEQAAIAAAQEAQRTGKFELLSQQVQQIENLRAEKIKAATELNNTLAAQANKLREQEDIAMKDNAIAELYTAGTTNVSDIMKQLREKGVNMTAKEVKTTLDNLVPAGVQDLAKTMAENGAPATAIQKVLSAPNLSDAYKNAGGWAANGTGDVGAYQFYANQAHESGVVPLGYQQWIDYNEDQDLKRQQRLKGTLTGGQASSGGSSGGSGGIYEQLDFRTANAVIAQGDKFASSDIVKKYNNIVAASNLIAAVDPKTKNPAEHQAIVYNFAKALDPDSVVREGEYATVKKYSQSLLKKYRGEIKQAVNGSGFLSEGAIKAIQAATDNRIKAYEPQYNNFKKETARKIDTIAGKSIADVVMLDYEQGYTPNNPLVQDQKKTQDSLSAYLVANPNKKNEVAGKIDTLEKQLGRELSADEFLIYYPEYQ